MINWITVDGSYLDYLRENVDHRIPQTDYGDGHYKPFFGALFEIDDMVYVAAVSHPQPRHVAKKSAIDFVKIFDGDKLLCVVNLNYMFPVKKQDAHILKYSDIDSLRSFASDKEKSNYVALLSKELKLIRKSGVDKKAKRLYQLCISYHHNDIPHKY